MSARSRCTTEFDTAGTPLVAITKISSVTVFTSTPTGEIKMTLSAEATVALGLDAGKIGSEYYVDFVPAEKA